MSKDELNLLFATSLDIHHNLSCTLLEIGSHWKIRHCTFKNIHSNVRAVLEVNKYVVDKNETDELL